MIWSYNIKIGYATEDVVLSFLKGAGKLTFRNKSIFSLLISASIILCTFPIFSYTQLNPCACLWASSYVYLPRIHHRDCEMY